MIVNLTPHPVSLVFSIDDDEQYITIPPTPPAARVSSTLIEREPIDGIPFAETVFGEVENLPEPHITSEQRQHDSHCRSWLTAEVNDCDCGMPVTAVTYGTYYVVSQIVIAACPERTDLVRPDTGPDAIRDQDGKIVAVRRLTR